MAKGPATTEISGSSLSNVTYAEINLSRMLYRLESTLLSSPPAQLDKLNHWDVARIGVNLEYARSLLAQLEAAAASSPNGGLPTNVAGVGSKDIALKKQLIKRLNERVFELSQKEDSYSSDDSSEERENLLALVNDEEPEAKPTRPSSNIYDSTLRSRHPTSTIISEDDIAQTTSSSATFATSNPLPSSQADKSQSSNTTGSRSKDLTNPADSTSTEARLDAQRNEQETLTAGLLAMAQQLKQSSQALGATLESEDKSALDRLMGAIDRNADGMKAAEGRMGTLHKMAEGLGFFNRLAMYAYIAAMWVALIVLMSLPKFR